MVRMLSNDFLKYLAITLLGGCLLIPREKEAGGVGGMTSGNVEIFISFYLKSWLQTKQ